MARSPGAAGAGRRKPYSINPPRSRRPSLCREGLHIRSTDTRGQPKEHKYTPLQNTPHKFTLPYREHESQRSRRPRIPYTCGMHRTVKNAAIASMYQRNAPPLLACTLALPACAHHAITDVGDFTGERSDPDVKTAFVPTPVITSTSALIRMVSKSPDLLRYGV